MTTEEREKTYESSAAVWQGINGASRISHGGHKTFAPLIASKLRVSQCRLFKPRGRFWRQELLKVVRRPASPHAGWQDRETTWELQSLYSTDTFRPRQFQSCRSKRIFHRLKTFFVSPNPAFILFSSIHL